MAFNWAKVGDSFDSYATAYLEKEKIKAANPAASNLNDYNQLAGARDDISQRVNAQPLTPSTVQTVAGAKAGIVNIGGVAVNKTALYVAGSALAVAALLKVFKVIK